MADEFEAQIDALRRHLLRADEVATELRELAGDAGFAREQVNEVQGRLAAADVTASYLRASFADLLQHADAEQLEAIEEGR